MAATANRRKQDDKNLEILRELISLNGNKYCLDCNQRGPTYVNTTIGSFVCSKCSGMLRGLTPPHRVKSISMATFTPDEIELIKARGNDYCRRVWLGLYEGESVNFTDEESIRDFMSEKYEKKRYYLEPTQIPVSQTNGSVSAKNKSKTKTGSSAALSASLLTMPPKSSVNNNAVASAKVVNNLLAVGSEASHKVARPTHSFPPPLLSATKPAAPAPAPAPVPDFPVDFSTAEIYNSSQFNYNNNINNNFVQPSMTTPSFNAFSQPPPTTTTNDRYAALADLDLELRQQNLIKQQNLEESNNVNTKNPFQSGGTNDLFTSKNPFFNGAWNAPPPMSVNPFMQTTNNGGFINSKNPFL